MITSLQNIVGVAGLLWYSRTWYPFQAHDASLGSILHTIQPTQKSGGNQPGPLHESLHAS